MRSRIRRDLRLLKTYAAVSSLALVVVSVAAFRQATPSVTEFDEINVHRINIVEADGRTRLVLSNSERQAQAVIDGQVLAPNRDRPAGMIFFNEVGDEVGGLIFSGQETDDGHTAAVSLTFDQWRQDQTVALQYVDSNGGRRSGLAIIDRPHRSLSIFADLDNRLRSATSESERTRLTREWNQEREVLRAETARRVYVGRNRDEVAILELSDAEGRDRLVLSVSAEGQARIRFLDENGDTVREIAP